MGKNNNAVQKSLNNSQTLIGVLKVDRLNVSLFVCTESGWLSKSIVVNTRAQGLVFDHVHQEDNGYAAMGVGNLNELRKIASWNNCKYQE